MKQFSKLIVAVVAALLVPTASMAAVFMLLVFNQTFPYHRWDKVKFSEFIAVIGKLFAELVALLTDIGLIVGALIQGGLNPMSVHMFIFYWGMLSFITPPVALGAHAAAPIAKASPLRTGFEAMRLGSIIYFVPFFFVFDPAFIWQDELSRTALLFCQAIVGITIIAGAL
jgi:hypothetical protein